MKRFTLQLIIAIITVIASAGAYRFVRYGIIYTSELTGMTIKMIIRVVTIAIPLVSSMWMLSDSEKRQIRNRWIWIVGNLLFTILVFPIYLLYRRGYKNRPVSANAAVSPKHIALLLFLFFIPSFISTVVFLAIAPRILTGQNISIFQFISEANKDRARYTVKPPFTSTTYLGKPYALRQCYDQVPKGFRYYAKHVHGWSVYIPKDTPVIQNRREPFPEIVLESPKRWICKYLAGDESSISWNLYTNHRYKFAVVYPPYWQLTELNTKTIGIRPDIMKAGPFPYKQDYGMRVEVFESPLTTQQIAEQKYKEITGKEKPKNSLGILYPSGGMWTIFEDGKNDNFSYDFGIRLAVLKKRNTAYVFQLDPYTSDDSDYDQALSSTYSRILEKFSIVEK